MPRTLQIESINSNSNLTFSTSSTGATIERLRISTSGNVGIGTTSMYTGSGVTSLTIGATDYPVLHLRSGANVSRTSIYFNGTNSLIDSVTGSLVFLTNSIEYMRINSSGNVGIGTESPADKLHVQGNIRIAGAIVRSAAGVGYLSGHYSSSESTTTSGAIYTIGGSYVPTASTLGNMYGIGYGYSGNGGIGNPGGVGNSIWGMYVASAGVARIFLDSNSGRGHFDSYVVASNITAGGNVTGNAATATGQQSGAHFNLNTGGPGFGLVGVYNPDVHQGLFAMGPAYKLADNGTLSNFYGVSWSYDLSGRQLNTGYNLQHCLAIANAGTVYSVIGQGIWTSGLIRANGAISSGGTITAATFSGPLTGNVTGNVTGNAASASSLAADTSTQFKIISFTGVGGDSGNGAQPSSYAIYQQGGSWTNPYPDLCIGYHTGIKIGAWYGYGGTRFFNNSDWATEIFSVGNGDNNVRVANTIYAGEVAATNNITAYYSDERLKNFIGKISNALEKVNSLNGYYFTENSKAKELGYNNDSVQVGISAQEVEKILPEIVTLAPIDCDTDSAGKRTSKTGENYKTVYYEKLIPLLIESIKELSSEMNKLKEKIDELKENN